MEDIVKYVLERRTSPAARAGFRRGLSPATEHYAYPYLAQWWKDGPYLRPALLAFAGLAAMHVDVGQEESVRIGNYAALLIKSDKAQKAGLEKKLVALQSSDSARCAVVLRQLIANGQGTIDWNDVWWTLRMWDHPELEKRRRVRRRILEDFYQDLSQEQEPTT
jgi:CRISPR type I-E-associated protein CasB/Cse2